MSENVDNSRIALAERESTKSLAPSPRPKVVLRSYAAAVRRAFLVLMLAGSSLITWASLDYFDFDVLPPFMLEKLPLRFEGLWLLALRIHVASALLTLPLCLLLMTRSIQRTPSLHRWLGRLAGSLVLVALVPSGAFLAFQAKGGPLVTAGFLLSAALVAWFMVGGVLAARRRELSRHRRAMSHVVAQMSVAVTSRALMIALDFAGMNPDLAYVLALWGPVLASAAIAEVIFEPRLRNPSKQTFRSSSSSSSSNPVPAIERIRREVSLLSLLVRVRSVLAPRLRLGR